MPKYFSLVLGALIGFNTVNLNADAPESKTLIDHIAQHSYTLDSSYRTLKTHKANWSPHIVDRFAEGAPRVIIWYEPLPGTTLEIPVRQDIHDSQANLINETNLGVFLDSEDNREKILPHGPSVDYNAEGNLVRIVVYNQGRINGSVKNYYPNGQLQELLTVKNGILHGTYETFYENGSLQEHGMYEEGIKSRDWFKYYQNDQKSHQLSYKNGYLHGEALEWYEDGILKEKKYYLNGLLHGDRRHIAMTTYYPDRKVQETLDFRHGQQVGMHSKYYANGTVSQQTPYHIGIKHGTERHFFEDGTPSGQGDYNKGVPVGKHEQKHPNGTLAYSAHYDRHGGLIIPIMEYDETGRKQRQYTVKEGNYDGDYFEWHPNGNLKCAYHYKNGNFNGMQQEYADNKTLILRVNYSNQGKDGPFEKWDANGQLISRINYVNGLKEGLSGTWDVNGNPLSELFYHDNLAHGTERRWHENGQLILSSDFIEGIQDGLQRRWNEKGVLVQESKWFEGKLHPPHRLWNEEGVLIVELKWMEDGEYDWLLQEWYDSPHTLKSRITLKDRKYNGLVEEFYKNANIFSSAHYKDNEQDGKSTFWHENGSLMSEGEYVLGTRVGTHREYYEKEEEKDQAQLAIEMQYDNEGKLHGESTSFYATGQKKALMNYEHDVLHGLQMAWDDQGNIIQEKHYVHNSLEGPFIEGNILWNGEETRGYYKNNQKHGLLQMYAISGPKMKKFKTFEANYNNGLLEGEAAEYVDVGSGIKIVSTNYHNGLKEGLCTLYDNNGRTKLTAQYHNDRLNGMTYEFYPNGNVEKQVNFVDDLKEGEETAFFDDGQVASIYCYKNGKLNGVCREWNQHNILTFEGNYQGGKRHGAFNKYTDEGKPRVLQTYENDTLAEKGKG